MALIDIPGIYIYTSNIILTEQSFLWGMSWICSRWNLEPHEMASLIKARHLRAMLPPPEILPRSPCPLNGFIGFDVPCRDVHACDGRVDGRETAQGKIPVGSGGGTW